MRGFVPTFTPGRTRRPRPLSTVLPIPAAPATPSTPSPADAATAYYTLLTWVSARATKFDIFLDTVNPPVARAVIGYYVGTSYVPTLSASTTYYWKIVAYNEGGSATGPVWSFTTPAATAVVFSLAGSIVTSRTRFGRLSIQQRLSAEADTASLIFDTAAPAGGQAIAIGLGTLDDDHLIFGGEVQARDQTYVGTPEASPLWPTSLVDQTFRLNKRRPFGTWTNVSASIIARALVATFAPGFTAIGVQDGLPAVSINFDGTTDFLSCLRALAAAISDDTTVGKTKVTYARDVQLFLTSPDTVTPDPIDLDHPTLNDPSPITFSLDHSQVRTRVYGKGHGEVTLLDAAVNAVTVAIADAVMFSASGGRAIASTTPGGAQTQIFTYTGKGTQYIAPLISQQVRTAPSAINWERVLWAASLGLFVAVAANATATNVMTSPDGVTWTTRTPATTTAWQGLAWSPELRLLVAVASTGDIMTSPDAITWTSQVAPEANSWSGVCWSPERSLFVVVGGSGTHRVLTSPNGVTWTAQTAAAANVYRDVVWSAGLGLFVACDSSSSITAIMTSPDGVTWTARTTPGASLLSVTWSPALGVLVAAGGFPAGPTGYVQTSTDGITWTARTVPSNNTWQRVYWIDGLGVFVGCASDGVGTSARRVMSSVDGTTWMDHDTPTAGAWWSIAWAGELDMIVFVGVSGSSASIMTSTVGHYDTLTGINQWNGFTAAIAEGSAVHIWVQRDDLDAQAALGALEVDEDGRPTDGIREYTIVDDRRGEASLAALCDADLAIFSRPIVGAHYYTRDSKTRPGRSVAIDLVSGTFDPVTFDHDTFDVAYGFGDAGDFLIQDVTIACDGPLLNPRYEVTASSVSFTLADLLRRVALV